MHEQTNYMRIIMIVEDDEMKTLEENASISTLRYEDIFINCLNQKNSNKFLKSLTTDNKIIKKLHDEEDHDLFKNEFTNEMLYDLMLLI